MGSALTSGAHAGVGSPVLPGTRQQSSSAVTSWAERATVICCILPQHLMAAHAVMLRFILDKSGQAHSPARIRPIPQEALSACREWLGPHGSRKPLQVWLGRECKHTEWLLRCPQVGNSTEPVAAVINRKPCPPICCRTDLVSAVIKRKLNVLYADSSQIDLDLTGEVIFPNLKFDLGQVDFGSVLNDSTARVPVTATNTSKVAVVFQWVFAEGQGGSESGEPSDLQCVSAGHVGHCM